MQSDWEIFNERYNAAPYAVQDFLDSDDLSKFLHELQPRLLAHTTELERVLALIADRILDILDEKTFTQELGFSVDDTEKILARIAPVLWNGNTFAAQEKLQAISPIQQVSDESRWGMTERDEYYAPSFDTNLSEPPTLKPRTVEKVVERTIPEPGAKPLTREEILQSLTAKRTLASDTSALQHGGDSQI